MGELPHLVDGLFQHQLTPEIIFVPAVLHAFEIDLVIDVEILEQVKKKQGYAAVVRGDQVG